MNDGTEPPKSSTGATQNERLESRVYRELLDQIRFGRFVLGQKLPSENELAAAFGVSRPVLRVALARLRDDGIIVSRRGAGSFVSSGGQSEGSGYRPFESVDDIAGYFAFRKIVEAETVSRAALRIDKAGLKSLQAIVAETESLMDAGEATIEADVRFHEKIAEFSDNRFLAETLRLLRSHWFYIGRFVRSLGSTGYRQGRRDMVAEHRAILKALEAGNADDAKARMLAHIDGSERRVFKGT